MNLLLSRYSVLGLLLVLLATGNAFPSGEPSDSPALHEIDALLDRGASREAWQLLQASPEPVRNRHEMLWRMARAQYEMGRVAESLETTRTCYRAAEDFARAAIAERPDKNDGYKWLAIALGAQTKGSDMKSQVLQSREVKESAEKAIELDPDDDLAYLVLSRWHYKVSELGLLARAYARVVYGGLPDASLDTAEQLTIQALMLRDRIVHRYNLAKIYDRMGRRDEAKAQFQKIILLEATFPEEVEEQEKARKKLLKWQ